MSEAKPVVKKLAEIALDSIEVKVDLKKLSFGLIDEVLEPALDKVVEDSTNPIDNAMKAMIYPTLEAELKKLIEKEVVKIEEAIKKKIDELKA